MKKLLLFLLTLVLGFSSLQLSAQETLTVANGTETNSYVPFYGLWMDDYTHSQAIYPADMLVDMTGATITAMTFHLSSSPTSVWGCPFNISLGESATDSYSTAAYITSDLSIVYTGQVTIANNEMTITFDSPFTYTGSNLVLDVQNITTGTYSSGYFYGISTTNYQGAYAYNGSSTPTTPSTRVYFIPKTTFTYMPSGTNCFSPYTPAFSDITAYTATLSWTPRDGQTAWEVCCLTDEDDIELASWTPVTDTFYIFTGLDASTHYTAYVRTDCGSEFSNPRSASFYTLCSGDAMPLPFSENFESTWTPSSAFGQSHNVPLCWAIYNGGATSSSYDWKWQRSTTAHLGTAAAACYTDYNTTGTHHNDWLITPPITLTGNQQVTFYAQRANSSTSEPEEISIWISDENITLTAPAIDTMPLPGFTQVSQFDIPQGEWSLYEISLAGYSGNRHVAFVRRNSPDDGYWLRLDDVLIDDIPSCLNPTNVLTSNITATSVDVDWTPQDEETAWEIVVVPQGAAATTGTPEQASNHPYTVNGLDDATSYDVYVRADCGDSYSYWSLPTTFTTHPFCSSPLNVTISQITATSALVSWEPAVFGATNYTIEYSFASEDNWIMATVDGTQFMLSGLEPDSTYNVMVYSNCDQGTADTVNRSFTTSHCYVEQGLSIGNGTSSNQYIPSYGYYNYSYTQQLYTAAELGEANVFSSISFHLSTYNNNRNIKIYLMHTSANSVGSGIDASNAQLVYSQNGTTTLASGWNTFSFTSPFAYNGTDNLLVVVIDQTGSYSSPYNYWTGHTASGMSCYVYNDNNAYNISTLPSCSSSDFRSNVIFGKCDNDVTCVRPNVYVTETSENSVTLDWAPGYTESAWDVEYSTDNTTWTSDATVNTHPYEVTGLNANTRYYFRVRSNCGGEESEWSTAAARTECGALTQLPYSEDFEDASSLYSTPNQGNYIVCWDRYASDPEHYVYIPSNSYAHSGTHFLDFHHTNNCFNIAIMPELDATFVASNLMVSFYACRSGSTGTLEVGVMTDKEDPTTFETVQIIDLSAASTYEYVEQHISLEDYTGNGSFVAFRVSNAQSCGFYIDDVTLEERPNCMYPSQVSVTNVGNNNVTLTWVEMGTATSWNIAYGTPGFDPAEGEGTVITGVTDNPYILGNLTPATTYDIYVQSDCGSNWAGPVSAIPGQYTFGITGSDTLTTCGVILYDDGGANGSYSSSSDYTLVIYPENPSAVLALIGTSSTESCCDYLRVYDGVGTSGQQLAEYKGEDLIVNVMSQSGPLTLVFHSDPSVVKTGFAITVSCVTCYPPTNVTASNPTLDGATVTWSGMGDSYVLFLNGDMTTGYEANDTTYTFSGLNPSTVYSVQVASICNGDTSMLSDAASFATACDAITITSDDPWTENFDSYQGSGAQTLVCWSTPVTTTFDNGTFPTAYCNYAASCHSGTNSIEFKGNNGAKNIAVLPEFTNSIHDLRLSFWATATSTSNGIMEVGVMTDPTDTSTFELVDVCGTPGSRGSSSASVGSFGNYMGSFDFNNTLATTGRIALRFTSTSSSLSWNLDDFIVELIPNCPSPVKNSVRTTNIGGHVATIYWVDEDDTHSAWTVYYRPSNAGNDDPWSYTAATDTFVQLTGLDPETSYDVYVITNCTTPDANPDATFTISFTTTVACPAPTGLTLASVSTDEATITWNGTASSYNVEYGETGFTPGTGTPEVATTESITLQNLTPSTSYTIYVNSDCNDANDSLSTTVSFTFTTTQIPADLPYTADFTAANEWILNNGTCTNYWATGTINSTPSLFVTNNGTTPDYTIGSQSVVSAEKLLAIGENASVNIDFDVYVQGEGTSSYSYDYIKVFFAPAETNYPATSSTTPAYASYTYDVNAVDFQNYLSQTGCNYNPYKLSLTNDTMHITVEMPNPYNNPTSTSAAKLVFLWRNDGSGGTMPGAIISNVVVSVNTCPMPSDLAVDNITSNSADVTWTAGDNETEWELEYGPHGFAHGAGTVEPISGTPEYSLSNLTSGTTYDIYVRAICSATDSSSWTGPVMVSPGTYNLPTSGTYSISTCDLTIYDDGGATGNYSNNCEVTLTINPGTPGYLVSISGTVNVEGSDWDYLYVYDGATTAGTQLGYYTGQNHTLTNLTSTTGPLTLRFHSDGSSTYSGLALTVACVSNTCPTPTDLTVSNITTTSADVSWTAGGSESAWVFEYKEASASTWTEVPVTNPSYQLTGLSALTAYNVRVKADCGSGDESAYRSTSFNTTSCAISDQCAYTFVAGDGYGDGWNDGYLTVEQNGVVVATVEAINHSLSDTQTYDSIVVNLCDGISTNLVWHIGQYDDEISITLIGPDGSQLYTVSDLDDNYSNPLYTFTTDCAGSGPVITDPTVATNAATAVNQTTATLNATINNPSSVTISAKGFEWKATNGGTYTQIAGTGTGNTFTANLTGLTANTSYTFKAFITFNGTTVYGSEMTFVTPETPVDPCDAPTNLNVGNITQTTAVMTWTAGGDETSWKVGYKLNSASQWQEATVATTTYTIEGLTAASNYDVRVKAVCANSESDFITGSFTTEGVGIDNITLANSINLMPNPADNYIELTVNSNVEVKEAVVFNAFGQMIQTIELNNNHARIDLSNVASGMYFVRVSGDNATATKKFIRK